MKINTGSILSLSALFAAGFYAATAHADMMNTSTPSQEAVQACDGKAENDACNFTSKQNGTVTGTCQKGSDSTLACMPPMDTKPAE